MHMADFSIMSRRDFLRAVAATVATGATVTTLSACNGLLSFGDADSDTDKETPKSNSMPSLVICKNTSLTTTFSLDPIVSSGVEHVEILYHTSSGLARWRIMDGIVTVTPELVEELPSPIQNGNGTVTYRYVISKDALWSDGKPITAHDFVYSWNRAANIKNGAPYRSMFDCIEGYSNEIDMQLAVMAEDDQTLVVTLSHDIPYWHDLTAFTPFLPLREDFVGDDYVWMTDIQGCPYSGPYTISAFSHGVYEGSGEMVVLTKNDGYLYSKDITVDEIRFVFGKKSDEMLQLIEGADSGDMLLSDGSPQAVHILDGAASDMVEQSRNINGLKRRSTPLLGTEWLVWNVNKKLVPDTLGLVGDAYEQAQADIRHAFALMMSREEQARSSYGYSPAPSIVPPGMMDREGTDFAANSGPGNGYNGYIDTTEGSTERNLQQAIEILKKYYTYDAATGQFTNVPPISYLGNGNSLSIAPADLISTCYKLGIVIERDFVEYSTLVERRQNGTYDLTFGNWYADFTDPVTFLSLWTTTSDLNSCQFGRGPHAEARIYTIDLASIGEEATISAAKWSETYDILLNRISTEPDRNKRFGLLHQAEDLVMSTWCVMPAIFPAKTYIAKDNLSGIEMTPFNWTFFGHVTQS